MDGLSDHDRWLSSWMRCMQITQEQLSVIGRPRRPRRIHIKKPPTITDRGLLCLMPDDDLLSHGETPHYHRRCIVSLLSSGWDQVVPMLYSRQANGLRQCCFAQGSRYW